MAYMQDTAGDAGRYVSRTARDHPMSLTMVGIGLGLLAFAATRGLPKIYGSSTPDHPAYPRYGLDEDATTFGQPVGGPARNDAFGYPEDFDTRGDLYPDIRGRSGGGRRSTGGYGDTVARRSQQGYDAVREGVEHGYQAAREGVEHGYESAREGVREGYESAREASERAARFARRQARHARSTATHLIRDEPLLVGAVGLAIGAIIGAVLPMTRRERSTMGRESDGFRDRVKEAAHEGYRRAEHAAEATYDAAKEEAKRQGFSSEGVHAAAESIEKKTASVYSAAMDTAKKEADRAVSPGSSTQGSSGSSQSGSGSSKSGSSTGGSSTGSSSTGSSSTGGSSTGGSSTGSGASGNGSSKGT